MSLLVDIKKQVLKLNDGSNLKATYPISTALNGVGQKIGSKCTPLGCHIIRAKIGTGAPLNTVFVARRQTGEIYSPALERKSQLAGNQRDWILTRILWLSGCEVGRNRLGECDTMRRYIYIHGCPDFHEMQIPSSKGCIKMRNTDLVDLFDRVFVGESIDIVEGDGSNIV